MIESERKQAEESIKKSTDDFDQAVNAFKGQMISGMDKASEMIDSIKRPKEQLESYVDETIQNVEGYVSDKKVKLDHMVTSLQEAASHVVDGFERRPLTVWVTVFFSGWILGTLMARKGSVGLNASDSGSLPGERGGLDTDSHLTSVKSG